VAQPVLERLGRQQMEAVLVGVSCVIRDERPAEGVAVARPRPRSVSEIIRTDRSNMSDAAHQRPVEFTT